MAGRGCMVDRSLIPNLEWFFLVKPKSTGGFVAFAKREPFTCNANFVLEPGEMWFNFGESEEDALKNLKLELFN